MRWSYFLGAVAFQLAFFASAVVAGLAVFDWVTG